MMDSFILYMFLGWIVRHTSAKLPPYRIGDKILPHHYDLEIFTNLGESQNFKDEDPFKFWGIVGINITVNDKKGVDIIVIHKSKYLTIDEKNVTVTESFGNQEQIEIVNHSYNPEFEFYIIKTGKSLSWRSHYYISIPFSSDTQERLKGFYRGFYQDSSGASRPFAVTQFEPLDARRAFPCFDEPNLKATFTVTIGRHTNYTALSNMPLEKTTPLTNKPNWVLDRFAKSVRMSTYTTTFVISDFTYREVKESKSGVKFRVWAPPEKVERNETEFAEDFAPKALDYFEQFFNINYSLSKVDLVAIPEEYFFSGAMENWGLITFIDLALLTPPDVPIEQKLVNAPIIAHELAHQWFGNLVTMEWWTDLWLNEGFASYFEAIATEAIYPESKYAENIFSLKLREVFNIQEPVLAPHALPNEIEHLFGGARYTKGMYIVRTLRHTLETPTFQKGLTVYLEKHKYANVKQDDLWAVLNAQGHDNCVLLPNMSLKTVMDTWTTQTGYPVLNVQKPKEGLITVSQHIFEPKPQTSRVTSRNASTYWWIPLTYTKQESPNFENGITWNWLSDGGNFTIPYDKFKDGEWVIFNLQAAALYRVNYYEDNWKLLKKALDTEEGRKIIHPVNRQQIINDALAFGWSGDLDYKFVFSLCAYIRHETQYLPLNEAFSGLREIDLILRGSPNYGYFKRYVRKLISPTFKRSGSLINIPKRAEEIEKKTLITKVASYYGIGTYEEQALNLFAKWYNHEAPDSMNPIPWNILEQVSCTAIKNGGDGEWDFLWERYLHSDSAFEKSSYLVALTCSREARILSRYLEWSIDKSSGILSKDSVAVFEGVAENEVGFPVAKDFLKRRVADIFAHLGAKNTGFGKYIEVLADQMITEEEYDEIKAFTEDYQKYFKFSRPAIERALDKIDTNILWHEEHYGKIPKYLAPSLKLL